MAIPDMIKIMVNKANSIALIVPVTPRFIVCPKGTEDRDYTVMDAVIACMQVREAQMKLLYGDQ